MSTSANFFAATVPAAARGTVTFIVRSCPISDIFDPMSFIFSPAAATCCAATDPNSLYSVSSCFSLFSVSIISLWSASHSAVPSSTFDCASLSCFSLSEVCPIACSRYFCFCVSSSVLPGSSFSSLLVSRSADCVCLSWLSTFFMESTSLVVSPLISIVIPFMRPTPIVAS